MTDPVDILVFGAHPDDAEIGMGGTIAKHVQAGYKVAVCDLTYAEMSSNGTVEIRQQEAGQASSVLGLHNRSNLGLPDRGLQLRGEFIEAVTLVIRKHQPRIVFVPYWQDRHPDHVACCYLVQEAVFNAKLRNYLPGSQAVTVEQLYFYFINDTYDADLIVDVSPYYSIKTEALRAYESQFILANDSVQTPLTQGYLERVEARDLLSGQKIRSAYAECFMTKTPYPVSLF